MGHNPGAYMGLVMVVLALCLVTSDDIVEDVGVGCITYKSLVVGYIPDTVVGYNDDVDTILYVLPETVQY